MKSTLIIALSGLSVMLGALPILANPANMVIGNGLMVQADLTNAARALFHPDNAALCETKHMGNQITSSSSATHINTETHKKGGGGGGLNVLGIVGAKANGSKDRSNGITSQTQSGNFSSTPILGKSCKDAIRSGANLLKTIHSNETSAVINADNNYILRYQINSDQKIKLREIGVLSKIRNKELNQQHQQMQLQLRHSRREKMF